MFIRKPRSAAIALRASLLATGGMGGLFGSEPPPTLDQLVGTPVRTEPGATQPLSDSPAITTILTREDLRLAGCRSVGEALLGLAGFYAVDDHLGLNFGIRGLSGGPRAYNRILKVMIDGQPVAFRADATTFLGPELIPMEAVERIEISRGPASALHGADAFLGAVNIVTRSYEPGARGSLVGHGSLEGGRVSSGGEALFSWSGGRASALVSAAMAHRESPVIPCPSSSPILRHTPNPERMSRNDTGNPASMFAKGRLRGPGELRLEWMAQFGRLSDTAEWAAFAPLSHRNHVSQDSGVLRLLASLPAAKLWSFTAHASLAEGAPGADERIASPSPTLAVRRDMGYRSLDAGFSARKAFRDRDSITFGVDWTQDDQKLMNVIQVDLTSGLQQATGLDRGRKAFRNAGAFLQVLGHAGADLDYTLNLRQDRHNLYGNRTSHRASLVYRLSDSHYLKLLQATSFKAPSPYQLYAQPLYYAEIKGNPALNTERARTTELEAGWEPSSRLRVRTSLFYNVVHGTIVLVPAGAQMPRNLGRQRTWGSETEARLNFGRQTILANASFQKTREEEATPFLGSLETPSAAFPRAMANLRWQIRTAGWGHFEGTLRYANPRRAFPGNIQQNYMRPYTLPTRLALGASYLLSWNHWSLNLKLDNLLDRRDADPGSMGYDLPGRGRIGTLAITRRF